MARKKSKSEAKDESEGKAKDESEGKSEAKDEPKDEPKDEKIEKIDHHKHILLRPDMYIGSTSFLKKEVFLFSPEKGKIVRKEVMVNDGLERLYIELLSNAIDNKWRSDKKKVATHKIEIEIDPETGKTSVWNDGLTIPVKIHKKEGIYNHELIFGNLLTSTNYNDKVSRKTSGRNGLGAKLTNVFSKEFIVESFDPETSKTYYQRWSKNMYHRKDPVIEKDKSQKKGYTKVTFVPDFKRFSCENYSSEMINLFRKHAIDAALVTGLKIVFNGETIRVPSIREYAAFYLDLKDEVRMFHGENGSGSCDVLIAPASRFTAISFVNGIYTSEGGAHIDDWCEAIFRPIVDKLNGVKKAKATEEEEPVGKGKKPAKKAGKKPAKKPAKKPTKKAAKTHKITIADVKKHFYIFLNISVVNPKFTSQEKTKYVSPAVATEVLPKDINALMKWQFVEDIKESMRLKDLEALNKQARKKKVIVDGLEDANFAGKKGKDCTLMICEGKSARTYIVHGLKYGMVGLPKQKGKDHFGVLPLTGKVLNVRQATNHQLTTNKVLGNILSTLGLQVGVDYSDDSNFRKLRYTKILIVADADYDGLHITGLVLNIIATLAPTLLERDYVWFMRTPIVRINKHKGEPEIYFYNQEEAKRYIEERSLKNTGKKQVIKYYKGLGTSEDADVKKSYGKRVVRFLKDDSSDETLALAFSKDSDKRKEWLESFDSTKMPIPEVPEGELEELPISDFFNFEMIQYSWDDCRRSISSVLDGLKESQRKILFGVFSNASLKADGTDIKVAQLAADIAKKTNYHHGEQNLFDTIRGMAWSFVGSNNVPLLAEKGMFGSRLSGGADGSAARYIFTRLRPLTRILFPAADDDLLERIEDDGDIVEPKFYIPILPVVLMNGSEGIGTGWSSFIPCFNPLKVAKCVKRWIRSDGADFSPETGSESSVVLDDLPELHPWYRGFEGTIEYDEKKQSRYITTGVMKKIYQDDDIKTYHVSELPIGLWTDNFRDRLNKLLEEEILLNKPEDHSDDVIVDFKLTVSRDVDLRKKLKFYTYLNTTNMVLWDERERIRKFTSAHEILDSFCKVRYHYYILRKAKQLRDMKEELDILANKIRFLQAVIDEVLILKNRDDEEIIGEMETMNFAKKVEKDGSGSYNYLLDMPLKSITKKRMEKLMKEKVELAEAIHKLEITTEKEIWLGEIENFVNEYRKIYE